MNPGLALFHSNDFDALVERLLDRLGPQARARPLEPVELVVSHPGLGRWLSLRIAERRGIAANLRYEMPAQFLWHWARENLPDLPPGNPFEPEMLLWHLYALLGEDALPAPLPGYLDEDRGLIKRYQLARRSAEVYARYALQRPAWLLDWARDRQPAPLAGEPDEPWQRELFRRLDARVADDGRPGPAEVLRALVDWIGRVADGEATVLPDRATVFGVSYLPPLYLDFFGALALRRPVELYFLNPTDAYWEREVSERTRLRRELRTLRAGQETPDDELFEIDHPLLAALGRHGAAFLQRLLALDRPDPLADADEPGYPLGDDSSLLRRVQGSLRELDPRRVEGAARDGSIQLHACYSPLREVQVLYDRLLVMLDEDPTLRPRDVLVLAPDIQRYAPYVRAVFRGRSEADGLPALPFNLSDRRPLDEHPLVASFVQLLSLPADEFEVDAVMALAEVPAFARRFGLDQAQCARLREWLRQSGVRWGLDAEHRRSRGGSDERFNGWQHGLDRMLSGFAVDEPIMIADRVLPLAGIEGQAAEAAGRLAWLVRQLAELREMMQKAHSADRWARLLTRRLVDALLAVDSADPAERRALQHVLEAVDAFRRRAQCGADPLPWTVVAEHLGRLLSEVPGRQAFLSGGVTFANMVPMRSIPARVVCLLGMDHGAFPRRSPAPQFDLTQRHPQLGDRQPQEEDRYLFLECLLSARDVLYVSYVGAGENDGEQREPSPLLRELQAFCGEQRVPTVCHPMQPFGRRAFDPDCPETHSPQARWMPAAGAVVDRRGVWFQSPQWTPAPRPVRTIDCRELLRFFRNPARHYLEEQLGLFLRERDSALDSADPIEPDGLALYGVRCRLMDLALANGGAIPQDVPDDRLRAWGDIPPGEQGARRVRELAEELAPFAAWVHRHFGNEPPSPDPLALEITLDPGDGEMVSLEGRLDLERRRNGWRVGALSAASISPVLVAHLLAHAAGQGGESRLHGFSGGKHHELVLPVLEASVWRPWLAHLVGLYRLGLGGPLPCFPKCALAFEKARFQGKSTADAIEAAQAEWERFGGGGEADDPYYRLVTRGWRPDEIFGPLFRRFARELFGPLLACTGGRGWRKRTLA